MHPSVVLIFMIAINLRSSCAVYDNNPFIASATVFVPQEISNSANTNIPPSPAAPGYVWVQVPVSQNNPTYIPTIRPTGKPPKEPITVRPPDADYTKPTTDGLVTIEPPEILYGGSLNAKCLKPRGQFPSNACNKYVNCWDGIATEQSCIEGLLFNPKGYCDYPANVNCNGKPIESTQAPIPADATATSSPGQSSAPTQAPSYGPTNVTPTPSNPTGTPTVPTVPTLPPADPALLKFCLKPRGQFPSKSCNKYVNCWDGVVLEQECPGGLLFSSKGYCDYPANVDCSNRTPPKNIEPAVAVDNECPAEFGTFRQRHNCTTYFTCIASKVVAKYQCPEGFLFNDNIGVCDYAERVDCSKEPILTRKTHLPLLMKDLNSNVDCLEDYGTFRDKNNCSLYYTCFAGKVVASYECPVGFNFNDNIGVCDYSYRVDCTREPVIFKKHQNFVPQIPAGTDFKDKIDGCKPGAVFRLNEDCSLACLCREGLAEIIQCPTGLAYDSVTDKCLPLDLARC
ncbi:probable chitinase 10 isoform X2 [Aethina tumida]|uniref:probable chitinase 10 isoform X2 n=1 Tax=Aethina tumida TaxID=116153 RepID=UPI002147762B|nr:probable chitinase 10 isoform X2 [Aethina tumida]